MLTPPAHGGYGKGSVNVHVQLSVGCSVECVGGIENVFCTGNREYRVPLTNMPGPLPTFVGAIPKELGELAALRQLRLNVNKLSGG